MENFAPESTRELKRVSPTFFGEVMSLFALAILISAVGAYTGFNYALPYFAAKPWLMYLIFAVELILVFTARTWSEKGNIGKILFGLFTFLTGLTLAPLLALTLQAYGGAFLYKALAATSLTFIGAGLIGWRTSWNLLGMRGFLFISLLGMIVVSVIGIFVPWGSTFEVLFSGFGVILFGAYTMYDFQRLKYHEVGHAMDAALQLYLDIFNLFIFILRFMGSRQN